MTTTQLTKTQQSDVIYAEEFAKGVDKLRARVIARFKDELSMKEAGASTYFQNCKTRAAGEKVKHYSGKKEKKVVDNSTDVVPESFEVNLLDGTIRTFLSQLDADLFIESNPSIVDPDQTVEEDEAEAA